MSLDWHDATGSLFQAFDEELARRPRGTAARVERAIGQKPGYLRKVRQRRRLRVDVLLRCLDALGIAPEHFFRRAFPWQPDGGTAAGEVDLLVAVQAFVRPAALDRHDLRLTPLSRAERLAAADRDGEIEQLDRLRYTQPQRARDRAALLARRAWAAGNQRRIVRACGVWGSALRLCYDFEGAWRVQARALEDAGTDQGLRAEMLRRLAVLAAAEVQPRLADALFMAAIVIHLDRGEEGAVARRRMERATILNRFGDHAKAADEFRRVIKSDLLSSAWYRGACQINRGFALVQIVDFAGAKRCCRHAAHHAKDDSRLLPHLLKLEGRIAHEKGDLKGAAAALEKSAEAYGANAGDRALVAVELVTIYLKRGQTADAMVTARSMSKLVMHLKNPIIEAAMTHLMTSAMQGELSLGVMARVEAMLAHKRQPRVGQVG